MLDIHALMEAAMHLDLTQRIPGNVRYTETLVEVLETARRIAHLPSVDEIDAAPDKAMVPPDHSTQKYLLRELAHKTTVENVASHFKYVERLDIEMQTAYMRALVRADSWQELYKTRPVQEWMLRFNA